MLATLGVTRRLATAADALPPGVERHLLARRLGGGIFVNYIRRARVVGANTVWVYVESIFTRCDHGPESAATYDSDRRLSGTAGSVAQIRDGEAYTADGNSGRTTLTMLVPDGVATVVLHYPAGRVGGYNGHRVPATKISANVVGNVIVVVIPRVGYRVAAPMTMTWRAPNGRTLKAFNKL